MRQRKEQLLSILRFWSYNPVSGTAIQRLIRSLRSLSPGVLSLSPTFSASLLADLRNFPSSIWSPSLTSSYLIRFYQSWNSVGCYGKTRRGCRPYCHDSRCRNRRDYYFSRSCTMKGKRKKMEQNNLSTPLIRSPYRLLSFHFILCELPIAYRLASQTRRCYKCWTNVQH